MKVQVGVDNVAYKNKPNKFEIIDAKGRTAGRWMEIDVSELAKKVSSGHAFLPGHLVGGYKSSNCIEMQLFALDFDSGISFAEIKERCRLFNLPISFAYHTFNSSKEQERFRVIFVHETLIDKPFIIKIAVQMFHKIFPESDKNCTNIDRLFLGGKKLICCNENASFALVQLLSLFHKSIDVNNNYKRNLQNFCKKQKILMINNRAAMGDVNILSTFDENDDFTALANIHIIGDAEKSSFFVIERGGMHQSNIRKEKSEQKRIDIPSLNSGCHLLDDFMNGEILNHNQRFLIVSNLRHINDGERKFLEVLKQHYGFIIHDKWKNDLRYMCDYKPMRCSSDICPYFENCNHHGTIVDTVSADRKVYKTKADVFYPLEEAVECLKKSLERAYQNKEIGVHLIKAQTSIGKTTQYIDLVTRHPESRFLIALPTNILKKQVTEDLLRKGIPKTDIFMTLSVSDSVFFQEEWESIRIAHSRGLHNRKSHVLKETFEKIKDDPNKKAMIEECIRLIEGVRAIKNERVVVTTHAALMQMSDELLSKFTIIIDEDILQLSIFNQMYTVSTDCLENVIEQAIPGYSQIANIMLGANDNEYRKLSLRNNLSPLSEEDMIELNCSAYDNVNDMQKAESFVKMKDIQSNDYVIRYFCPHKFSAQKYIILSATLNENVYRNYFGEMLPVYSYESKQVAYKGKVIQYTYHSLGRRDLSRKMEAFEVVKKLANKSNLEIITFKEGVSIKGVKNMNTKNMHFGNTTGINSLSGQDIGIVGTPYKIDAAYKLIACYFGANVNNKKDDKPRPRRVEYKGYNFYITSYSDEVLREVQLYAFESELEQCIGRARLLRNDCTVYVLSAFPCEQAELHSENYLS